METACNGQIKTTGFPLCNGRWMLWKKQLWEETLPIGTFYYPCIFMYKLKSSPGFIYDWKSRLVALENLAKEGIHYQSDEISSSVFSYDSLRTVISLATGNNWDLHQLDISNAYLNSPLMKFSYDIPSRNSARRSTGIFETQEVYPNRDTIEPNYYYMDTWKQQVSYNQLPIPVCSN